MDAGTAEWVAAAGLLAFFAAMGGGVGAWVFALVAWLKLKRRMTTDFPGQWEELQVWDGIKMTGSNAVFGMEGGTPAMWNWVWERNPCEPMDVRALKSRCRRGFIAFFSCLAVAMLALGACFYAARFLPTE
jgi:hypothetical protein